mgnify:CR=1 FL=1
MLVEVKENYPIKNLTSFKIGGDVEKLYFPKTEAEFTYLLKTLKSPLIFGSWSNVLISSEGIKGNVISTSMLNGIEINGTNVEAQCGVKGPMLAQKVTEQGLTGFEFMAGFPGSIGGNIYMNASAHKQAISDYLVGIKVFIKHKKYFYYVSDVVMPMNKGIAFERGDDILLWLSTNKQKQYIINKGYQYLDRMMLTSEGEIKKKIALVCVANW